jgi:hypothetical protein
VIEKRVLFEDADGAFWTSTIRDPRALQSLQKLCRRKGLTCLVFSEAIAGPLADGSFQRAYVRGEGGAAGFIVFGPNEKFTCQVARADQKSADKLVHAIQAQTRGEVEAVVGGWPLLDTEPSKPIDCDEADAEDEDEGDGYMVPFVPPLPDKPTLPPAAVTVICDFLTWIERILTKLLIPEGKEARR